MSTRQTRFVSICHENPHVMKISDLISKLTEIQSTHGDLEVIVSSSTDEHNYTLGTVDRVQTFKYGAGKTVADIIASVA